MRRAGESLTSELATIWLFIHATFATAAVGFFLVAAGSSTMWLWKLKKNISSNIDNLLPKPEIFDENTFRNISIGFLFYTVMVISGSIWANNSWGRYWGWDPIETWSLITWFVYAIYLHLHYAFPKARGKFSAWYSILAVFFAVFSLWGVGMLYDTIHRYG